VRPPIRGDEASALRVVSGSIGKGIETGVDEVGYGDLGGLCGVRVI
jgi:hypothetical protein